MEIIRKYFPDLSPLQNEQFLKLPELYSFWNERINVISRKDIGNLYLHHVLHALSIAKVVQFKSGAQILDIGTGGGFPGIPLAILFPEADFFLVDSIAKKIKVVNEVAQSLGLQNVKAEQHRAEEVNGKFDFITARGVTELRTLWLWSKGKLKSGLAHSLPNGLIALKGGNIQEELSELNATVFKINAFFTEEYFEEKFVVFIPKPA